MSEDPGIFKVALDYAWAAVAGLATFLYGNINKRIDAVQALAEKALSKEEFKSYTDRAETTRSEIRDSLDHLYKAQNQQSDILHRILGKLDK
tara:strand:- start:57 stop:332 length:276 start_codon:yes stop_codon:yes gene_type:complete